ncbi:MAG: hypothetical protein JXP34_05770 [Planctomycetes bacterium]|nr:hypothetical protein [Planctomycetota bacterium]
MMRPKSFGGAVLLWWILPGLLVPGAGEPSQGDADEEIPRLARELDADDYDTREAATERLAAIGKPAIPALEKAAAGESLEATLRAVEILERLRDSDDEETRTAARQALERLSEGEHAAAARQAKKALAPKIQEKNSMPFGQLGFGAVQIQIGGGLRSKSVSVRNVNGVKEIDATEDGRKIRIREGGPDGIRVEITATKDGKEKTDTYAAKDAEELKKKHPEAHRIYEEYAENRGAATVQFRFGDALPLADGSIESITHRLQMLALEVEGLAEGEELRQASPQAKAELRKRIAELKKGLEALEGSVKEEEEKKPADVPDEAK